MTVDIVQKATRLIDNPGTTASIGLHEKNGDISVSAISSIKAEGLNVLWFSTNTTGRKANLIKKDNRVGVCYFTEQDNVSLSGTAEIVTDEKKKEEMWLDWFKNHYKDGPTDKDYCLVKVTVKHARLYVDGEAADFGLEV